MKADVDRWAAGAATHKVPSKETLNHAGLVRLASGRDPYTDTRAAFQDAYRMHGFENFLLNIAMSPDVIHTLVDRVTEMYLELNEAYFSTLKGNMEIWFFGNDFGSQESLLMSVEMCKAFFFENIQRLCTLAHAYNLRVMMHSCGAVAPLIPLLIEAGVDILDPIQPTAKGMDAAELAAQFGGRITFHGGIDTQKILPFGSVDDVRAHVRAVTAALAPTGRYIFAPSQILGPDIPPANILAMYQTIREINHERGDHGCREPSKSPPAMEAIC